jgi:hypothetical protein
MRSALSAISIIALLAMTAGSAAARPATPDSYRPAPSADALSAPQPAHVTRVADGGVHWTDVGIGAGLATALLLTAAAVTTQRRRPPTTAP